MMMMMMRMMIVIGMEGVVVNVLATVWWSIWIMLGNYPKIFCADCENWLGKEKV